MTSNYDTMVIYVSKNNFRRLSRNYGNCFGGRLDSADSWSIFHNLVRYADGNKLGEICLLSEKDLEKKIKRSKVNINSKRKKRYGIDTNTFDGLLLAQEGRCKICGVELVTKGRQCANRAVIDHCHGTKKVRGILCHHCNASLGGFKDDISLLEKAIRYLNESR